VGRAVVYGILWSSKREMGHASGCRRAGLIICGRLVEAKSADRRQRSQALAWPAASQNSRLGVESVNSGRPRRLQTPAASGSGGSAVHLPRVPPDPARARQMDMPQRTSSIHISEFSKRRLQGRMLRFELVIQSAFLL